MQRVPGRVHLVSGKRIPGHAPLGNDRAVELLDGDPVGGEHGALIRRAIRRDGRSLFVQPYGHAARICVLQDALQGKEAAATDNGGLNLVVATPALQTAVRIENFRQQLVHGFSFQSSSAIAGISKRSRVRVYQPPSMRPIRSSFSASTCWRAALVTASSLTCTIRILPSTTPKLPSAISCMNMHSIETGACAIRGTATRNEGASDSPASFGSSTPLGNAIDVTRISCASANGTRLTTNCSLVRILARVSFGSAGPLLPMPIPTVAGSLPKTLKNENGAALIAPAASRVVTHAIGRGKTVASSNLYRSRAPILSKSNCMASPILGRHGGHWVTASTLR